MFVGFFGVRWGCFGEFLVLFQFFGCLCVSLGVFECFGCLGVFRISAEYFSRDLPLGPRPGRHC